MKSMQRIIAEKLSSTGAPTQEEVYQAMLKGFQDWEHELYSHGLRDGELWSGEASQRDLEYAASGYVDMSMLPAITHHEPTEDPNLGEFFKTVFDEYRQSGLEYEQTGPFSRVPNGLWQQWEKGFLESVRAYREKGRLLKCQQGSDTPNPE